MIHERAIETVGLLMIGDGLAAAVDPKRHCRLWLAGPKSWRKAIRVFLDRPGLTRGLGIVEAGLGLWLAQRQRAS